MEFEIEEYVIEDGAGGVIGTRIEWREARVWAVWLVHKIGEGFWWLGFFLLWAAIVWGVLDNINTGKALLILAVCSAAIGVMFLRLGWKVPGRKRWIEFGRDGTISSTENHAWRTPVSDIANIEWEQIKQRKSEDELPFTHGVRILTKRGRVIHLAKNLEPDDAAHLAAVLMSAREEVKYVDMRGVIVPDAGMVY